MNSEFLFDVVRDKLVVAVEATHCEIAILVSCCLIFGVPLLVNEVIEHFCGKLRGKIRVEERTATAIFVPECLGTGIVAVSLDRVPINDAIDSRVREEHRVNIAE